MEFEAKIRDFIEAKCEDYFLGTVDYLWLKILSLKTIHRC